MGVLGLIGSDLNSQIGESSRTLSYVQRKEPRCREVKRFISTTGEVRCFWGKYHIANGYCLQLVPKSLSLNHKLFWSQKSTMCLENATGPQGVRSPSDSRALWTAVTTQGIIFRKSLPVIYFSSALPLNPGRVFRTLECPG